MAERVSIAARARAVTGKQVRRLRREGRLPANVYGRGIESLALDLDAHDFSRTIKRSGSRALFDLSVEGEAQPRPVVVRQISRKGGTGDPIHVDFFQVDPRRPIQATVGLRLVGEAPAVRDLAGTLAPSIDNVQVRCFPLAIPETIDADLSKLTSFDVTLTVGDLSAPADVEILTDPSVVIATVIPPRIRTSE
jgi:large subunit ribosomal protein L25